MQINEKKTLEIIVFCSFTSIKTFISKNFNKVYTNISLKRVEKETYFTIHIVYMSVKKVKNVLQWFYCLLYA